MKTLYLVTVEGGDDEHCETLAEAEEIAHAAMEANRNEAQRDREWPDETAVRVYRLVTEYDIQTTERDDDGTPWMDYVGRTPPPEN